MKRPLDALALLAIVIATGSGCAPMPAYRADGAAAPPAEGQAVTAKAGSADPSSPAPAQGSGGAPASPATTDLYHSEKGNPKDPPIVFIHGGPGANSMMFEVTVQDSIAKLGTYVVAYDQRGSTRSPKGTAADDSFAKATQDLDDLIGALGLHSPILLAHSFGGAIALHYLDRFPGKAKGAILAASPMDFPETYETTLTQCAARYRSWFRYSDGDRVDALRAKMFPQGLNPPFTYGDTEIDAVIACQSDARLYFPEFPTAGELAFGLAHATDTDVQDVNTAVGAGFQANDKVGFADYTPLLVAHAKEVVGIYAPDWDVMFSQAQLGAIQAHVRAYFTVADSGHFIFMDQPDAFTSTVGQAIAALE
jgi:proline iminopeptidase